MRWTVAAAALVAIATAGCSDGRPSVPASTPAQPVTILVNGRHRCICTPIADGCYTARHCFEGLPAGARVTVGGLPLGAYSVDPARDLAHVAMWADPTQVVGGPMPPEGDESSQWYGRRSLPMAYLGQYSTHGQRPYLRSLDTWAEICVGCQWGGSDWGLIRRGDSGSGVYYQGRLVGILARYDDVTSGAWTVRVP